MGNEEKEWMLSNLVENEKDEEEEEEALSLCDLPNSKEEKKSKKESLRSCSDDESQEEFDFWWWGGSNSLKESQMCAADDVFFQGQILPLRHSISSDAGKHAGGRCHSFRYNTSSSSRSSSVRSHLSSSSATSSASTTTTINSNIKKQSIRKQSTPPVRFSKVVSNNNHTRNSGNTLWTIFRDGLVSTPEIDFHDLKIRQHNNNNNNNNNRVSVKRNKNMIFFSSCSCSVNDVQTAPPRMATKDKKCGEAATKVMRKQATSRLRTFEWLKQLSLEGSAATTL